MEWMSAISGIVGAAATAATAIIAFIALKNWKHQDVAKRKAELLDQLIEAVHTYIAETPAPITLLEMSKIGMESHIPTWKKTESGAKELEGAVIYIAKHGEDDAQRLNVALAALRPLAARIMSLGAKAQVFKFDDYRMCFEAIKILIGQSETIGYFTAVIGSPSLNWEHPDIAECLKRTMAISPTDIRQHINDSNIVILGFVRKNYEQIYG